ncbi:uncharacterized protein [Eucyclogobius newberryi]|uniref:uncharacterized protein n=1 Tax=Eucyclogobius newberryi TaxID=166745 RepID=UPI003B5BD8BC
MMSDMMRVSRGKKIHSLNEYILCNSSARLKHSGSVSLLKSLLSNPCLKPLVPPLCLLLFVIHGLGDKLHNFVAGIFIPQYHYPYAVSLCFGQAVIALLFLNLPHLLGVVSLQSYSRVLGEKLLVPSICSSIYGVLSMWAKANCSNSGLFPLVMPLLPLLIMLMSFLLKLPSPLYIHISVLISFFGLTIFVTTVAHSVPGVDILEYIYAPLALILFSVSLIWLAKVSEVERQQPLHIQASVFDIYYCHLVNQSGVLGILWLLHSDNPWHVLSQGSWHSLLFHGYLLAILLLGMALNFVVGITVLCFSPLAGAVLHSAYQLTLPFLQYI